MREGFCGHCSHVDFSRQLGLNHRHWLVVWNMFDFFHILGIVIQLGQTIGNFLFFYFWHIFQLTNIFQRAWNHEPGQKWGHFPWVINTDRDWPSKNLALAIKCGFNKPNKMGISINGGTPSHHPFLDGIFPNKNHLSFGVPPWLWKHPYTIISHCINIIPWYSHLGLVKTALWKPPFHYWSLLTIINHHEPSWTIMNHH